MKYDEKTETYTFTSGRAGQANCGIIGIGPDLEVTDGYDGGFYMSPSREAYMGGYGLSQDEREELADFMIARWTAFKTAGQ